MKKSLVVTTIQAPTTAMRKLAEGAIAHGFDFHVVGDEKTPKDFDLSGAAYYGTGLQSTLEFKIVSKLSPNSYARKNIGYLVAMGLGADIIKETDDDNSPLPTFWNEPKRTVKAYIQHKCWVNPYQWFTSSKVWPRGLPLDEVGPKVLSSESADADCPIQQGLVNGDPDVDAIFRLTALPMRDFRESGIRIAVGEGAWCPFNSQNTLWFQDAFPLMYLPSTCSIRLTDIWRSFVAQRICWEHGWSVLFHGPTAVQERNPHNLMRDFEHEIPGYVWNKYIAEQLESLSLGKSIASDLVACYELLCKMELLTPAEMPILEAWLEDVGGLWQK
jgi:hypothetical protein